MIITIRLYPEDPIPPVEQDHLTDRLIDALELLGERYDFESEED